MDSQLKVGVLKLTVTYLVSTDLVSYIRYVICGSAENGYFKKFMTGVTFYVHRLSTA